MNILLECELGQFLQTLEYSSIVSLVIHFKISYLFKGFWIPSFLKILDESRILVKIESNMPKFGKAAGM